MKKECKDHRKSRPEQKTFTKSSRVQMSFTKSRLLRRLGLSRKDTNQVLGTQAQHRLIHHARQVISLPGFCIYKMEDWTSQFIRFNHPIWLILSQSAPQLFCFPHLSSIPITPALMCISWPTTAGPSATLADITQLSPEPERHLAGLREAGQHTHPKEVRVSLFPPNRSSEHSQAELQHRVYQHHRQSSLQCTEYKVGSAWVNRSTHPLLGGDCKRWRPPQPSESEGRNTLSKSTLLLPSLAIDLV